MNDPRLGEPLPPRLLEALEGSELLARMAALFTANTPRRVARLRRALQNGDREELLIAAYSLASTSAVVGAEELRALAIDVEHCVHEGDLSSIEQLAEQIDRALAARISAWVAAGVLPADPAPGQNPP